MSMKSYRRPTGQGCNPESRIITGGNSGQCHVDEAEGQPTLHVHVYKTIHVWQSDVDRCDQDRNIRRITGKTPYEPYFA